jgi:uridine kinase
MPPRCVSRAEAVAEAVRFAAARPGQTLFVGVDGRAGSGKSTLAAAIASAVPGAVVVSVDDFAGPLVPEWDWPRLREQVLDPLLAGRPGRYQRWEWNRDEPAEWRDVPPGRLVVIEGVSATRSELAAPWALRIWVDAPRSVRLQRAVERDGKAMLSHWVDVWMPSEEAYIDREQPQDRADLIVLGTE